MRIFLGSIVASAVENPSLSPKIRVAQLWQDGASAWQSAQRARFGFSNTSRTRLNRKGVCGRYSLINGSDFEVLPKASHYNAQWRSEYNRMKYSVYQVRLQKTPFDPVDFVFYPLSTNKGPELILPPFPALLRPLASSGRRQDDRAGKIRRETATAMHR